MKNAKPLSALLALLLPVGMGSGLALVLAPRLAALVLVLVLACGTWVSLWVLWDWWQEP